MENTTFFKKNAFIHKGFRSKKTLKKGVYYGQLTEVRPGQGKAYHGAETRDTITFFFELEDGQVVTRTVGASNHQHSKCMELVTSMSAGNPPSINIMRSTDKLQNHILSLVSQKYWLDIQPSPCGRFNNIEKVTPEFRKEV